MTQWLDDATLARMSDGYCPDCGHRGFILGPRGGSAINIECGGCGARFNVAQGIGSHRLAMAHRIPKASEGGSDWSKLR